MLSIYLKYQSKILWLLIIGYIIIFSFFCLSKYQQFGYNSLDLAILNQVFYNTSAGHAMVSSIHYPSYLGDHFKPIIFLLLPIYFLAQAPQTLLILQTVWIALAAWPLYLIGKKLIPDAKYHLLPPLLFLLSPYVHNTNLFEFHLLPLAFLTLFFAFYFYLQKNFRAFLIFIILSLLIREDISLFVFCFGLFIFLDQKLKRQPIKLRWILTPLILGLAYFFLTLKIINHYNPDGYKFLIYYAWLGETLPEIAKNFFLNLPQIFLNIFRLGNVEMTLALLLPLLFLPLGQPSYLLLGLGNFLQLTLSNQGASLLVVQLHYSTLLLIPLLLATITGFAKLKDHNYFKKHLNLIAGLLLLATIYSALTLGLKPTQAEPKITAVKKEFLQQIPANASVVASYEFLTPLSNRPNLYSFNYVFIGKKQYSQTTYIVPNETEYLLADLGETVMYQIQYRNLNFYRDDYFKGGANLRNFLAEHQFGLVKLTDTITLWQKNAKNNFILYQVAPAAAREDRFSCQTETGNQWLLNFSCQLQLRVQAKENYQLKIEYKKNSELLAKRILPLAYGLYGTSELKPEEKLTSYYSLLPPPDDTNNICLNLIWLKGDLGLNHFGSIFNFITNEFNLRQSCFPYLALDKLLPENY